MIENLIRGDWYIVEVVGPMKREFITSLGNFTIGRAEEKLEEYKFNNQDKKYELLLVVSK